MLENLVGLEPGTVVNGQYRINGLISSGGMGWIYEASQLKINRKVTVKLLNPQLIANKGAIERFRQEANLAGSIAHINICEVTDLGATEGGIPYLVMPCLEGMALSERLRMLGSLPTATAVDIVDQILAGLEMAHRHRIVHRDLKPANIFLSRVDETRELVKILDFGISKILDAESNPLQTTEGVVLGTPVYMAPEQAGGSASLDQRVDIYAAGVILYECLTGRPPYTGSSFSEIMLKIARASFPLPRSLNPAISKALEKIILRAMAYSPGDRYRDARKMRTALSSARQARPALGNSKDSTVSTNAAPFISREMAWTTSTEKMQPGRKATITLVGLLLLLATCLFVSLWNRRSQDGSESRKEEASRIAGHSPKARGKPATEAARTSAPSGDSDDDAREREDIFDSIQDASRQCEGDVSTPVPTTTSKQQRQKSSGRSERRKGALVRSPKPAQKETIEGKLDTRIVSDY